MSLISRFFLALFVIGAALAVPKVAIAKDEVRLQIYYIHTVGDGHLRAAEAIKKVLEARYSNGTIRLNLELVDMTRFMNQAVLKIVGSNSWANATRGPIGRYVRSLDLFTGELRTRSARTVSDLNRGQYNLPAMTEFINESQPDIIISTFTWATQSIAQLRSEGRIDSNIRLGWMLTDYMAPDRLHQLIAQSIDISFLPSDSMMEDWTNAGINSELLAVTAMPTAQNDNLSLTEGERMALLESMGLSNRDPVVVITGGGAGFANYEALVRSIANNYPGPIQVIAVTARNETQFQRLQSPQFLRDISQRSNMKVVTLGLISNLEQLFQIASVVVTAPGGLTPAEIFKTPSVDASSELTGVPTLLLPPASPRLVTEDAVTLPPRRSEVLTPAESNRRFYTNQGLALELRNAASLGYMLGYVLNRPNVAENMKLAQTEYTKHASQKPIVDFVGQTVSKCENSFNAVSSE